MGDKSRRFVISRALKDWALFGISLVIAYFFSWTSKDLLWSFWISSFFMGCLAAAIHAVRKFQIDFSRPSLAILLAAVIGFFAFFVHAVFYGFFYALFGAMIDLPVPLVPNPNRIYVGQLGWRGGEAFSLWRTLKLAVINYWPWMIILPLNYSALLKNDQYYKTEMYWDLLRMFFLMFVLMFLAAWRIDSFLAVAVISIFLFIFRTENLPAPANGHPFLGGDSQ